MDASGTDIPKESNRGLWIGLGVGCLALLLCGAVAAVLFFGGFLSFLGTTAPVIENIIPEIEGNLDQLESGATQLEDAFGAPTGIQGGGGGLAARCQPTPGQPANSKGPLDTSITGPATSLK